MQSKCIALFSTRSFLKNLLEQSHPEYSVFQYQSFDILNAMKCSIVIVDDKHCSEELLFKLSNISNVISLNIHPKSGNINCLSKPIKYLDLCNIIDKAQNNILEIGKNLLLNIRTKNLIKISGENIKCISLTDTEVSILKYLLSNKNNSKNGILDLLGYKPEIETHTIDTHLSRLRKKLEPESSISLSEDRKYKFLLKFVE